MFWCVIMTRNRQKIQKARTDQCYASPQGLPHNLSLCECLVTIAVIKWIASTLIAIPGFTELKKNEDLILDNSYTVKL